MRWWSGWRSLRAACAIVIAVAGLVGCGSQTTVTDDTEVEPITWQAVALIVMSHQGDDPSSTSELIYGLDIPDPDEPQGLIGASVRYEAQSAIGRHFAVSLIPTATSSTHPLASFCTPSTCAELPGDVTLGWQLLTPEEDPGIVWVTRTMADAVAYVELFGPEITGDPRTLDLGGVTVDDLVAVLEDKDLRLETRAALVREGENLDTENLDPESLDTENLDTGE